MSIVNLRQGKCIECKPGIVVCDSHRADLGPNQTIGQWCWRAPMSTLPDVPHCVRSAIQNGMNKTSQDISLPEFTFTQNESNINNC